MDKVGFFRPLQPRIWHTLAIWFLGITALIALGILEQLESQGLAKPLHEMVHNSAQYLHTLIETLRLAATLFMLSMF